MNASGNMIDWLISTSPRMMLEWLMAGGDGGGLIRPKLISPRQCRAFAVGCILLKDQIGERHWIRLETGKDPNPDDMKNDNDYAWAQRHAVPGNDFNWNRNTDGFFGRRANLLRDIVGNPFRVEGNPFSVGTIGGAIGGGPCQRYQDLWDAAAVRKLGASNRVIRGLAQAAYDRLTPEGLIDPDRLLVLADACEEAGCASEDLLYHLRGYNLVPDFPGGSGWDPCPRCGRQMCDHTLSERGDAVFEWRKRETNHFRGCWVVDLLLGIWGV